MTDPLNVPYADLIVAEATKIAESKFPDTIQDENIKKFWISGFVSGYLNRLNEEVINLKK